MADSTRHSESEILAAVETSPLLDRGGVLSSVHTSPNEASPQPPAAQNPMAPYSNDVSTTASTVGDEESLLTETDPAVIVSKLLDRATVLRITLVLLMAVFVVNADHSLVLATHASISSEFDALRFSSWILISFSLSGAATQAIFGKLSDIYGRKSVLLLSYFCFAIGCLIVAMAPSMSGVIAGRVLSGAFGGGITALVSVIITDIVPVRESATWRGYVNIASTTGRSLGGPLGGWLTDVVGWRWSFGCQVPILLVGAVLCWWNLPDNLSRESRKVVEDDEGKTTSKFKRIDFLGATLLAVCMLSLLMPLELGGNVVAWTHPLIPGLFSISALLLGLFVLVEKRWAKEPIMEPSMFAEPDAVLSFLIMAFQTAAQLGLMFSVPIYFQITQKASNTEAGARLFPAVAGNAISGIIAGMFVKRTGKYKPMVFVGTLSGALCYSLLLARWHGHTGWLETFYIMPGGFGIGLITSILFVAIQAVVEPSQIATAVSTLFLSNTIGATIGIAGQSAILQEVLAKLLPVNLSSLGLDPAVKAEIIDNAVANVEYIFQAKGKVAEAIVKSYIDALWYTHALSLSCVAVGFILSLFLKERRLQ